MRPSLVPAYILESWILNYGELVSFTSVKTQPIRGMLN